MMHIKEFTFNAFQTRCCIVWDEDGNCAFIDPGAASKEEKRQLIGFVEEKGLTPCCIMLTHAHFDHIYGMSAMAKEYEIPVYAHLGELSTLETANPAVCSAYGLPLPDTFPMIKSIGDASANSRFYPIRKTDVIEVGSLCFKVIETPGHTIGGVCYLEETEKVLFSGDTLFAGAIGRTDHPGGDYDKLMKSILENVITLDGSITVIPGHGPVTDIATEGMTNPFLLPFNEPYED